MTSLLLSHVVMRHFQFWWSASGGELDSCKSPFSGAVWALRLSWSQRILQGKDEITLIKKPSGLTSSGICFSNDRMPLPV